MNNVQYRKYKHFSQMNRPQKATYHHALQNKKFQNRTGKKTFEDYTTSSAVAHSMDKGYI
jgi:hypothetical protein